MDRNHKLDAPNNEELKTIEQIDDHSGLTTVYREAGEQFHGNILSASEREKLKDDEIDAITSGISKSAPIIGLLIPYPFLSGLMGGVYLYSISAGLNAGILYTLLALLGGTWLATSYMAYARIFHIFYRHALRVGPFLLVMLISVLASSQAFMNIIAQSIASESLVFNIAAMALLVILYSIIISYIVLKTWGNSHISSGFKIAVSGIVLIFSGLLVGLTYLL